MFLKTHKGIKMPKTNYVCLSDQAIWLQLGTLKGAWKNYVFSALGLDRDLGFSRGTPSGIPPRSYRVRSTGRLEKIEKKNKAIMASTGHFKRCMEKLCFLTF